MAKACSRSAETTSVPTASGFPGVAAPIAARVVVESVSVADVDATPPPMLPAPASA